MISERSNKGKEKLIEDGDHNPSQNNLPGSQNFGGGGDLSGRRATEAAAVATCSHSAPKKKRTELLPLSDVIDQINPHRLRWTEKLHNHFVRARKELVRRGEKVTAKTLTKEMGIDGIHQYQVKSRLQAFREGRITEENWKGRKNNKAEKIDGQKSGSNGTSTSSREHGRNGIRPGMRDQNVGGKLETGTVTIPLYSAQQQPQVDVADISAANGGCFMTSNGYSFPRPYNIPTTSAAINNVQVGLQDQTPGFLNNNGVYYNLHWFQPARYGVGLQMQTPSFQNHNGYYYNLQPGNEAHWFQPAIYGVGLQMQTPGFQNHNGFYYNLQPGNEAHWPAIYGVGLQMQTPGFQNHNGICYNLQPGNEAHWFQPAIYGVDLQMQTHRVQQLAHDGGALGNIQQQNQAEAATGTVQGQNGIYNFRSGNEAHRVQQPAHDVGALGNIQQQIQAEAATGTVQGQNRIYNFRSGNEAHRVQQPAHDGGALGNIQNQNQYFCLAPQVATDTVQAQNATAIMPDNMVTTEDQVEDFLNLDSLELGIADFEIDFDFSEPFGFA